MSGLVNVGEIPYPNWLRRETVLGTAEWDCRGESALDVSIRLLDHLRRADELLGVGPWTVNAPHGNLPVDPEGGELLTHVERAVFRDDDGVDHPSAGYSIQLSKDGEGGFHSILASVGSSEPGRVLPSNYVTFTLGAPRRDGRRVAINSEYAAMAFSAMIRVWAPDSAALRNKEALAIANREERGDFPPLVGQWAWVSERVGVIASTDVGISTVRGDGGTYVYADDELDAAAAVRNMRTTFETNSMLELPFKAPMW
ncbi:hypothetical protein [Curtobacterium pusillum]|uniref:hypothetical protein n=1 Tax=Curtobacterium pusillum TaxID=69373 RepID=UPI00119D2600|nr:hypothetical protein [Curtobacterium pusillum]